MKKISIFAVLLIAISVLLIPSICFADVAAVYHLTAAYVTMTAPDYGSTVPTDLSAGKQINVSNIVWKDPNGKVLTSTSRIVEAGKYTLTFDLDRVGGDRFSAGTYVYVNSSMADSKTCKSSDKIEVVKTFDIVANKRLSNASGKAQYMEDGGSSTTTTSDGKKVMGYFNIFIEGNVEEGKALPNTFQANSDLDKEYRTYVIYKSSPTGETDPYAVWQQYDEKAQAGKTYTCRYYIPVPSDTTLASDFKVSIDGNNVSATGLGGSLVLDREYKTGAKKTASITKYVDKVTFQDYVFPTAGQELNPQDVKLKEGFPGVIESANYTMFQKTIAGTASMGDDMALYIRVELDEEYEFKDPVATLNGKTQDMRIHNDSMGNRLYGFVWNYTIPASNTIKIEDQSPETVEYVEGEDIKLFVKATGASEYQWYKYSTTGGGIKQKYSPSKIDGATKSEYTIEKASKDLDGAQYRCTLTAKDKSLAYTLTMTLKLVTAKLDTGKSGDVKYTETKSGDTKPEETKKEEKVETITWSKASSWAVDELDKANKAGLIPTIFDKEDLTKNVTRKEFAHIAVKLYEKISGKKAEKASKNPFTDTKDEEVLKAFNVGITQGTSETTFAPDKEITREQMATMMTRALKEAGVDTKVDLTKVKEFSDDNLMHNWSREAIYFMSEAEIIKGVDTTAYRYGVTGTATREQALLVSIRSAEKFAK